MLNQNIFHNQPVDWRIPIATGFAAGAFALMEKALPEFTIAVAWLAVGAILITRVNPAVPSPTESALTWFNSNH